jgi:hypothetical protein
MQRYDCPELLTLQIIYFVSAHCNRSILAACYAQEAVRQAERSFSAAGAGMERLVERGIAQELAGKKRNRASPVYAASSTAKTIRLPSDSSAA